MERINRLYTYTNMYKNYELLKIYIDKITNNKSVHIKFIEDFDSISMDLLYTGIKFNSINHISYDKLDKKELNYYIKRAKGLSYFTKQNKSIKDKEYLVNYLFRKLKKGDYYYSIGNVVCIGSIIVDINWLVDFSNFLVNSYYLEELTNNDNHKFIYIVGDKKTSYEYIIEKTNKKELTYHELLYLYDVVKDIDKYEFKELKTINSMLHKDNYVLSVNKTINGAYVSNRYEYKLAKDINEMFELYRSIAHAYSNKLSLKKCRELFTIKDKKYRDLINIYSLYYIEYLYDYNKVYNYLDYDSINTYSIKPSIIDYSTREYKVTLQRLIKKRKQVFKQNKVVDICLQNNYQSLDMLKDNGYKLSREANKLYHLVMNKKMLENDVNILSKLNEKSNRVLFNYIKEALFTYSYKYKKGILEFTLFDKNIIVFGLNTKISVLEQVLLDEDNYFNRIKIYEKE